MTTAFAIPFPFLRTIAAELQHRPYQVAVGAAGLNRLPTGESEVLVRSFRFVHEGKPQRVQREQAERSLCWELGFAPFPLTRPEVWRAMAFVMRAEGALSTTPTCSLLLGSGQDVGLFTGVFSVRDQAIPVQGMTALIPHTHFLPRT